MWIARYFRFAVVVLLLAGFPQPRVQAQTTKPNTGAGKTAPSSAGALALAQQGHCKEAIPGLKSMMVGSGTADTKKSAGVTGLRCALALDDRNSASDFIRQLNRQFSNDPDILFILVHAYSDLSTRTAQDLGRTAPQSVAAHKLNAEALEMQGKWDDAQREYETILEKEPNAVGIHYLLGRLFLSKPDADAQTLERAKQEFVKELEVDPSNAGAHYVLGQLAAKAEDWDEAIRQFSQAAQLDPNFAEAYVGWGFSLVTLKKYDDAVAPLRKAETLTPGNPAVHYALGTALSRTGHKEEAEKEFEIHRKLTATTPVPLGSGKP